MFHFTTAVRAERMPGISAGDKGSRLKRAPWCMQVEGNKSHVDAHLASWNKKGVKSWAQRPQAKTIEK